MNPETRIDEVFRLTDIQKKGLAKLGLKTVQNLLYYFPQRYGDVVDFKNIIDLEKGQTANIYGQVTNLELKKSFRTKVPMAKATITDTTGSIRAAWFHQPYVAKMLQENMYAKFSGTVSQDKQGVLYLSNPEFEKISVAPETIGTSLFGIHEGGEQILYPVYSETQGVTSKWLFHAAQKLFTLKILEQLHDPIPDNVLKKYNLPTLTTALIWIHAPKKASDSEAARKRFAFEEVFLIQLRKQREHIENEKNPAFVMDKNAADIEKFTSRFSFAFTGAQQKAIAGILMTLSAARPCHGFSKEMSARAKLLSPRLQPMPPSLRAPRFRPRKNSRQDLRKNLARFRWPTCARRKFWRSSILNHSFSIFSILAFRLVSLLHPAARNFRQNSIRRAGLIFPAHSF